jgi:hypothetical protein
MAAVRDDSLTRVLSRGLGRLITGPVAFLVAGIIDVSVYLLGALARRANGWLGRDGGRAARRGSTIPPR